MSWTVETLKEHFEAIQKESDRRTEQRFSDQEKAVSAALAAAEKAVNTALISAKEAVLKAENASEKRFESVNEFRSALNDQTKTLITRTEVEQVTKAMSEKVADVVSRMDRLEGRSSGLTTGWAVLVGGVGLIATVIAIYLALNKG